MYNRSQYWIGKYPDNDFKHKRTCRFKHHKCNSFPMKRIIYQNNEGGVSVIIPSPNWRGTIEELAAKDVPAGAPYKIVEVSEIPSDRTFRNAWEYSE